MQTYQSTPDFYRDYIEHGWLKDQAAKVHKYISRWRGKNGKWYYRYKQEITDLKGRYRTRNGGRTNIDLDERENERGYSSSRSRGDQIYGSRNAKNGWSFTTPVKGLSDRGNSRSYSEQGVNRGISAGRKRTTAQRFSARKGAQNKKGKNLRQRGYSSSKTYNRNDGVSAFAKGQGYASTLYTSKSRYNSKMDNKRGIGILGISAANYLNNKAKKYIADPKSNYNKLMNEKKKKKKK